MKLSDSYKLISHIIKKIGKGQPLSVSYFSELYNVRQIDYFESIYKSYENDTKNTDSLRHFKTIITNYDISIVDNAFELPSDYFRYGNMSYIGDDGNYIPFDMVTKSQAIMRKVNSLTIPTVKHPVCYVFNNTMYIEPYDSDLDFVMLYLRYPNDVYLDYYIDANGMIVYLDEGDYHDWADGEEDSAGNERDSSDSGSVSGYNYISLTVEPEWNDEDNINILRLILTDIGITLDKSNIYQYATTYKKEG